MHRILTSFSSLILVGLAAPVAAGSQAEFEQAYAAAEAARQQADSVGGEWRDVGKMLSEAKKTAAAGEFDKANTLVAQALEQSQLGYRQALEQRNPDTSSLFGR